MENLTETLSISQLIDRIYNLKERGKSFNQTFNDLSNGLIYGTLIVWKEKGKPEVKTLAQLREQINKVYHPALPNYAWEGGNIKQMQLC